MKIERTEPMRVHGNVPTGLIRRAYRDGGDTAALKTGSEVLINATTEQILAIAHGKAEIRGVSPDTEYVETQ